MKEQSTRLLLTGVDTALLIAASICLIKGLNVPFNHWLGMAIGLYSAVVGYYLNRR